VIRRGKLGLAEPEQIVAMVAVIPNVGDLTGCIRVGYNWFASNIRRLPSARREESPLPGVSAQIDRLPVARKAAAVGRRVGMERSGRNTRPDVYNRGVPLPILGIPSTGLEVDLVNYGRVEQFVETAGLRPPVFLMGPAGGGHRMACFVLTGGGFGVPLGPIPLGSRAAGPALIRDRSGAGG